MELASFLKRKTDVDLLEEVFTEGLAGNIDEENGILKNVKILGAVSKNGRTYSDAAQDDVVRLAEGIEVNVNHPPRNNADVERLQIEGWGVLKESRRASDGPRGDLHYLKSHPETPMILERVRRGFPIGLSINAKGKTVSSNGKTIVESVARMNSVDLVRRPGATKNLFESESPIVSTTVKAVLTSHKAAFPKLHALIEEIAADAVMADAPMEAPAEEASPDEQIKAAFRAAVVAAFDDDKLDATATLSKIKEILKSYDKLSGKGADKPEGGDKPKEDSPMAESIAAAIDSKLTPLVEQVGQLTHELAIRKVLENRGLTFQAIGPERKKLLESQEDESSMNTLIESWPPYLRGASRPVAKVADDTPKKSNHVPLFKRGRR